MGGAIVLEGIVEHMDVAVRHDDDAGARRHARDDVAGGGKVARVVGEDLVGIDAGCVAAGDRKVRQVEHQDAAGIVAGDVSVHVRAGRVLDLDAGDVELDDRVAHDDVGGLADIDAGVRGAADGHVLDQHVLRFDRVDAVGAIGLVGLAAPFDGQLLVGDPVGALGLDAVALGIADGEVRQGDIIGRDQQAFAGARLLGEVEHGDTLPRAAQRDAIHVQRQRIGQREGARGHDDRVAGLGIDQRALKRRAEIAFGRQGRRCAGL